nr:MAG TPA: hypothetical protein [Caudoviricetes sp.]
MLIEYLKNRNFTKVAIQTKNKEDKFQKAS